MQLNIPNNISIVVFALSTVFIQPTLAETHPETALTVEAPPLSELLHLYSSYRPQLERYAQTQGFILPYEHLKTVIIDDEINAYTHVIGYVGAHAPLSEKANRLRKNLPIFNSSFG